MKSFFTLLLITISLTMKAQNQTNDTLPYATIPEAPEKFTPGTVVARMVDGLGFRYRWATEALSQSDYDYAPGNEGRTIAQTMEHLYGLSKVILNTAKKQATDYTLEKVEMSIAEKRRATLENLKNASALYAMATDLNEHQVQFKRTSGEFAFPFWNNINGPIEDAVWHAGQIVVLRRAAGNPINPKVNVFLGKLND